MKGREVHLAGSEVIWVQRQLCEFRSSFFVGKLTTLAHLSFNNCHFWRLVKQLLGLTSANICMETKQISDALLYISGKTEWENHRGLIHWGSSRRNKTALNMRINNSLTVHLYINWANMFTASTQKQDMHGIRGLLWRYGALSNCRAGFPKWNCRGFVSWWKAKK